MNSELAGSVDLSALFDEDPIRIQGGYAVQFPEKNLNATSALVKKIVFAEPVSKKCHVGVVEQLDEEVKDARRKSEVNHRELSGCDKTMEELKLLVHFLADDS